MRNLKFNFSVSLESFFILLLESYHFFSSPSFELKIVFLSSLCFIGFNINNSNLQKQDGKNGKKNFGDGYKMQIFTRVACEAKRDSGAVNLHSEMNGSISECTGLGEKNKKSLACLWLSITNILFSSLQAICHILLFHIFFFVIWRKALRHKNE